MTAIAKLQAWAERFEKMAAEEAKVSSVRAWRGVHYIIEEKGGQARYRIRPSSKHEWTSGWFLSPHAMQFAEIGAKEYIDESLSKCKECDAPAGEKHYRYCPKAQEKDTNMAADNEHAPFGWTVFCKGGGNTDASKDKIVVYKRTTPADAEHYTEDLAPFTFPTKREAVESGKRGHYAYKKHHFTACNNYTMHDRNCDCADTKVALINGKEVPYKMV
jgi:hypothetical protein